jgi:hypothetical protein
MNCEKCDGSGTLKCSACLCTSCAGSGQVACLECKNGQISCEECSATGQIPCHFCFESGQILQNFWFIKWRTPCSACEGKGRRQCSKCLGKKSVPCRTCGANGNIPCKSCGKTGLNSTCVKCAGSRLVQCLVCEGTGKVETEWSKQLKLSSLDSLWKEYNDRMRRKDILNREISIFEGYVDEDHKSWMRTSPTDYQADQDYRRMIDINKEKILNYYSERNEVENELSDIMKYIITRSS